MNQSNILEVRNLNKSFSWGGTTVSVLSGINFELTSGASVALVGPSGSGKTTLLGLCAGLDRPDSGEVIFQGRNLASESDQSLSEIRRLAMGFVFQNYQLVPSLTALENVVLMLELSPTFSGRAFAELEARARELLGWMGLAARISHYPSQLSGGEQQRVALARAFSHQPRILFADEPTGNLDAETSAQIVELLFRLNTENNTALLLVTHNQELAAMTSRTISLKGGRIV